MSEDVEKELKRTTHCCRVYAEMRETEIRYGKVLEAANTDYVTPLSEGKGYEIMRERKAKRQQAKSGSGAGLLGDGSMSDLLRKSKKGAMNLAMTATTKAGSALGIEELERLLPKADLALIFGNIVALSSFHKRLAERMLPPPSLKAPKKKKKKGDPARLLRDRREGLEKCINALAVTVAEVADEMTELYSVYCKGFDTAQMLLKERKKRSRALSKFLDEQQKCPEGSAHALEAILIEPIQRLCRYPMLVEEMCKKQPEGMSAAAKKALNDAFDGLKLIALNVNKTKLAGRKRLRLIELYEEMGGSHGPMPDLAAPHRHWVAQGAGICRGPKSDAEKEKTKPHTVVVISDCLLILRRRLVPENVLDMFSGGWKAYLRQNFAYDSLRVSAADDDDCMLYFDLDAAEAKGAEGQASERWTCKCASAEKAQRLLRKISGAMERHKDPDSNPNDVGSDDDGDADEEQEEGLPAGKTGFLLSAFGEVGKGAMNIAKATERAMVKEAAKAQKDYADAAQERKRRSMAGNQAFLASLDTLPPSSVPYSVEAAAVARLPAGSKCEYLSRSRGGWVKAVVVEREGLKVTDVAIKYCKRITKINTYDPDLFSYFRPPPKSAAAGGGAEGNAGASDGATHVAAYDYDADGDDELSLQEGDRVTVTEKSTEEWWTGTCNGKSGVFPSSYVEPL